MSAFIVGLTGGIGSGKSKVSDQFEQLGITVVDADVIAREVVAPGSEGLKTIAAHFGPEVLTEQGELDRAALRARVFDNENERQWLNGLTHPLIRQRMLSQCEAATSPYALMVVPLMVENGLNQLVHRLAVVDVPESVQQNRTAQRDGTDEAEVAKIMARQASREERLAEADDVIDNSGSVAQLQQQVQTLHHTYLELARKQASAAGV
ncbi:dephospho-CoA kinase [Ferrimonas balearica]|uniref:dephospho-CoA kinase n=1 Tax=Ferrimonas balearica TaxID=44012 RepID=UPI001C996AC1|nr:dephospho-CoA kinase [Ferrimonas balearica]MBY5992134.1 dephospho-CoA kinase [Ferrimonas balearica]